MNGNREEIFVGVDSGRLIIIDPCYLGETFYNELLKHRCADGSFDTSYLTPNAHKQLAVVVSTRGDGLFPVEVSDESVTVTL